MNKENHSFKDNFTNGIISPFSEVTLIGNKTLLVEGASSVLNYNDDSIKLKLVDLTIIIYGVSLCISYLNQDSLEINGKISRIEYV